MTEQEFYRQIWRAYDKVTFDGNIKARVVNVCFPTLSVRVSMPGGTPEWIRCERIDKHISQSGDPTDEDKVVENMFKELMAADEKIKRQGDEINRLKAVNASLQECKEVRLANILDNLRSGVNMVKEGITIKKAKMEHVEKGMQQIDEIIELLKGGED